MRISTLFFRKAIRGYCVAKKAFAAVLPLLFLFCPPCYSITDKEVKDRIIPIIDATAYESYSRSDSGSDLWGFNAAGIFAPNVRLTNRSYLLPLYQGAYLKQYQVVNEDEGNQRYSENMTHNTSLSYYYRLTDRLSAKVTGISRLQFNNETSDESWGTGLYDYRDFGAALDATYRFRQAKDMLGEFFAGFEYYMRLYPNYRSLISLISVTAPETHEKDYNGYQIISGYRVFTPRYNAELKYTLLIKYYLDKRLIGDLGILENDSHRMDYFHMGNLSLSIPLEKHLTLALNTSATYNTSNQNYYDSRGTPLDWSDDVFTYSYYDYYTIGAGPGIFFRYFIPKMKNECVVSVTYDYTFRQYTGRKAQDSDSTYLSSDEADTINTVRWSIKYPLAEHLSVVVFGDNTFSGSNMKYDRYYRYNYNLSRICCGINVKY